MARVEMRTVMPMVLLAAPLVIVKLAAIMLGQPGPGSARAAISVANPDVAGAGATAAPIWSERQLAAAKHVQSLHDTAFGPAPLLYNLEPEPVEIDPIEPEPDPVPQLPAVPKFELNAIMSAVAGDKAVINGRAYIVGEHVRGTEWIVASITPGTRSVTLRDTAHDRTVTLMVETPM